MTKNAKQRKLSLKKVTVATLDTPALGVLFTDAGILLATVPTGQSVSVTSNLPMCRLKR
jgi:hypothetical protein